MLCFPETPTGNCREFTHLQGTFLPSFLAITLQHFAINAQAKNLSCYFVVIRDRVSPELQFTVSRWLEARAAAAAAGGVTEARRPVPLLRTGRVHRPVLLIMMHFPVNEETT